MNYTQAQLSAEHAIAFRRLRERLKPEKGGVVGETWQIRVADGKAWLVTPYWIYLDGQWVENEELTELGNNCD